MMGLIRVFRGGCGPRLAAFGGAVLGLVLAALMLLGGCVSTAARNAAVVAYDSGSILRRASIPDPRYNAADREAYERLWATHESALKAIAEELK